MDDLKAAMKDKDIIRKNTVQMIRSAILQFEKDNKAARLNARFCGYREFSDIVINNTEYKLYIRSF